jgi:hypothetical protein
MLNYKTPGLSKFKIFIFKLDSSEKDLGVNTKQLKIRGITQKSLP